jgi:hypothetical protein
VHDGKGNIIRSADSLMQQDAAAALPQRPAINQHLTDTNNKATPPDQYITSNISNITNTHFIAAQPRFEHNQDSQYDARCGRSTGSLVGSQCGRLA